MEEKLEKLKEYSGEIFKDNLKEAHLPPESKTILLFDTFCMDEGKVAPVADEPYIFSYEMLDMPMFLEIMFYLNEHPEIDKDFTQTLMWKLCKRPKFNGLKKEEQEFLFKINEFADAEVNNYEIKKYPEWKGVSKENWPEKIIAQKVPDSEIYGKFLKINGFSQAEVEFYNPTEKIQKLVLLKKNPGALSGKFFNSDRQRLGFIRGKSKFDIKGPTAVAGVRG